MDFPPLQDGASGPGASGERSRDDGQWSCCDDFVEPVVRLPVRCVAQATIAIDSMPGKVIMPQQYARRLFRSSFTGVLSIAAASLNDQWDCCCCASLVTATSLMHWYHPQFGLRRALDLVAVWASATYQLTIVCPKAPSDARMAYYASVGVGAACYAAARRCNYTLKNLDASTRWHVGLHAAGNAGNMLLYDAVGLNLLGWLDDPERTRAARRRQTTEN